MSTPAAEPAEGASSFSNEKSDAPPEAPGPEPRSLPWWKQRCHEAEAQGQWLHAEVAAERDKLAARVESMQRAQIETLIGARLHRASDFWLHHPDVSDLLDDDGTISPEKVDAALAGITQSAPYLAPSAAAPAAMVTAEHAGTDESGNAASFAEMLKEAARSTRGVAAE